MTLIIEIALLGLAGAGIFAGVMWLIQYWPRAAPKLPPPDRATRRECFDVCKKGQR
jgi:hypothetical protein